jgi:hypothetical protein
LEFYAVSKERKNQAPTAYSEDVVGKEQILDELRQFVTSMGAHEWAVVTLDNMQSVHWETEGDIDYQDYYGGEIIKQADDGETHAIVIHNVWGLPVALALKNPDNSWQGIGVVQALREDVALMLVEQDQS